MSNEFRSFIEETEFFRGQIVYNWKRPNIPGATSFYVSGNCAFNPYSSFQNLYEHQKDLVDKLHSGENILFLAPFNTGRTTIALLYSLDVVFNKHKSVLLISSNSFEKELEKKLLNKILTESKLDWLVDIHDLKEEIDETKYSGLFPSIYIIDVKDLHWFLLPNHSKYSLLFESLGLIIYDDFEKLSGNLASNLYFINKRFEIIYTLYNQNKDSFQFLILSKPFYESKRIVENIFEKNFEIIYRDSKEIVAANVFYWVPAFDKVNVIPGKDKTLIRTVQRDSFIDDTYILAFESLKKGKTTVVYYSNIPFSRDDIAGRQVFLDYFARYGEFDLNTKNFFIGYDWSDLTAKIIDHGGSWEEIDTIIIAMFSGSIKELRDDILHVGNQNSEIFITMPQTPSFQYEIIHPGLEIKKDTKEIAKGESLSIFAFGKGESVHEKHKLISAYEMRNFLNEDNSKQFYEAFKIVEEKDDLFNKCDVFTKKLFEIKGYDIYSTDPQNFFVLFDAQNNLVGSIDPHELADSYFKNAVVCIQNMRYKVTEVDLIERKIKLFPLGEFILPISKRKIVKVSEEVISTYKFSELNFEIKKLRANASFNKYKFSTGTDPHPNAFIDACEDNLQLNNFEITGVEISGFNDVQAISNIFDISLNTKISLYNLVPYYFINGDKSFFYNLGSGDLNYLINDTTVKNILERALTILIDCPCQNGCSGCLENYKSDFSSFAKKELIDYLGKLLKEDNLDNILRWKYEQTGQRGTRDTDMLKFKKIRSDVLKILEYKANMKLKDPYQESFLDFNEKRYVGLCFGDQKTVYVHPDLQENYFIDVCAHEYTHNWQDEGNINPFFYQFNMQNIEDLNNIWFGGKIFLEGQANFFAAKVMDYFGQRDMVYQDEIKAYAQYREGLILLNFLEKKYGLIKLNSIIKTAAFENKQIINNELVYKWYYDSGVRNLVDGKAKELFDGGNMKCLTEGFLDKTIDYNRITYFMNHQIDRRDKKLSEYIEESGVDEEEAYKKIWTIIKDHFHITPKKGFDELPCNKCAYKDEESLDGLCMMFGSISVKEKIKKEL